MQDQRANIAYNLLSTPFSSSCFLGFTLVGLAPMQSINEMRFQSNLTKGMLNDGKVGSSVKERKGLKRGGSVVMQAANDVKSHPYLLTMFACQKILIGLSLIYLPFSVVFLESARKNAMGKK